MNEQTKAEQASLSEGARRFLAAAETFYQNHFSLAANGGVFDELSDCAPDNAYSRAGDAMAEIVALGRNEPCVNEHGAEFWILGTSSVPYTTPEGGKAFEDCVELFCLEARTVAGVPVRRFEEHFRKVERHG